MVAISGTSDGTGIPAVHFAQAMQEFGCRRILFTDTARDGTMAGPNAAAVRAVSEAVEIPVIAKGGVHKATDIRILRNITNVEGAVVGSALCEGTVRLPQLLTISSEQELS
jgi:phosphoribosylformimino-5-aminoimidazole carboxamide ribotide isomerase